MTEFYISEKKSLKTDVRCALQYVFTKNYFHGAVLNWKGHVFLCMYRCTGAFRIKFSEILWLNRLAQVINTTFYTNVLYAAQA